MSTTRADEPAEALAYYLATNAGRRSIAVQVRQGVAAAAKRLYTERAVLKYDTASHGIRMADVLNLTHPDWGGENRALFDYILHRAQGHKPFERYAELPTIAARAALDDIPQVDRRAYLERSTTDEVPAAFLKRAGMTWKALSGWLGGAMDATAWESVIPSMGYMALLRNLRNFDQAGVSDDAKVKVTTKLTDPDEVAASRQFPIRFYSAYRAVTNDYWRVPLGRGARPHPGQRAGPAGAHADPGGRFRVDVLGAVRPLHGRTARAGETVRGGAGATSRARRHGAVLDSWQTVTPTRGSSVLNVLSRLPRMGGGTMTFQALEASYSGHDRVVILTDEQAHPYDGPDPSAAIRAPIFTFNLAGYRQARLASGPNRFTFGGLTDAGFTAIAALEERRTVGWPF